VLTVAIDFQVGAQYPITVIFFETGNPISDHFLMCIEIGGSVEAREFFDHGWPLIGSVARLRGA
jgi:hypothetical protein